MIYKSECENCGLATESYDLDDLSPEAGYCDHCGVPFCEECITVYTTDSDKLCTNCFSIWADKQDEDPPSGVDAEFDTPTDWGKDDDDHYEN